MAQATFTVRKGPSGPDQTLVVPDLPGGYVTNAMMQDESVDVRVLASGAVTPTKTAPGFGASAAYTRAAVGVQTLMAAATHDRFVEIAVEVTTVFANGDGAQPTFKIGETDTDAKFAPTTEFTNAAAARACKVYAGILLANKALIVTAVAATGTTSTGALRATAQAVR